ncbi:uncharacterized protein LOC117651474 [Thrips palmi]|uniref:Uncharacterized protein LOC117651474 n=1 Tax=Thrips palmi TaxID=161013 RepID=A0A6P9A0V8_THRPL|nr:uncharacterized protein LOC117651474 [Thrips palmi]XP_034251379.1 uncharacterized protein LOC117651474 [Thrips palmi]XP_034251380.1 uncharacterized protein LOC117651474 [Thrips palmi]XP_034251381.1 uncharacterized protein LOC117651474 [Thrips palmi]XP_034251382.1 uncharacterized protein LOC117651474 [Thrips palmi]XP_034251383.1 uncharacterized protein LOC117651474 [Thrips palmi]XP_034251384.1 uncharacterized protein LOC117651474 [Thrips palmi]XP_034251385.1 uncharacterized protein LOC1176
METNCAAAKLSMSLGNLASLVLGALVVRRQAALGRLRHLELSLELTTDAQNSACVHTLLQEVHAAKGLVKLVLRGSRSTGSKLPKAAALDRGPVAASLKQLQFEFVDELVEDHLLPFVSEHLATLEIVQTKSNHATLTALLASAPRLRKLGCHMLDNMMTLRGCPSLTSLHLFVDFQDGDQGSRRLAGVEAYLRVATWQLTRLKLEFAKQQDQADVVDLVLALGGTRASLRPSTLRCLALDFSPADLRVRIGYLPPLQLRPLAAVLHRLPDLRHLNLGGAPSDAFLDAIDPQVLPKLVKLQVYSPHGCTHEWFHTEAVTGVFRRNPRLHLVVESCGCDSVGDEDDSDYESCAACAKDCCPDEFWEDTCTAAFFSHPDAEPCDWVEIHREGAIVSQSMQVKV